MFARFHVWRTRHDFPIEEFVSLRLTSKNPSQATDEITGLNLEVWLPDGLCYVPWLRRDVMGDRLFSGRYRTGTVCVIRLPLRSVIRRLLSIPLVCPMNIPRRCAYLHNYVGTIDTGSHVSTVKDSSECVGSSSNGRHPRRRSVRSWRLATVKVAHCIRKFRIAVFAVADSILMT
jgi:hypothetical protein